MKRKQILVQRAGGIAPVSAGGQPGGKNADEEAGDESMTIPMFPGSNEPC